MVSGADELDVLLWFLDGGMYFDPDPEDVAQQLPIDKPISVEGFRDQVIGLDGNAIGIERTVPMAGTLGLGYVLNLAQVWKYDGLTLGNLVYSLVLGMSVSASVPVVAGAVVTSHDNPAAATSASVRTRSRRLIAGPGLSSAPTSQGNCHLRARQRRYSPSSTRRWL